MRKPIVVANWKMNNTVAESIKFVAALSTEIKAAGNVDVVIAPPFTALYSIGVALADTEFKLAAQNVFWEESGAFTGEVAAPFLSEAGVSYVIIGHSERRQFFGETDETVNRRVLAALRNGLIPILCVGELSGERDAGITWEVVKRQLTGGFKNADISACGDFTIAYEPVWAIGTGRTATPAEAEEVHAGIRKFLRSSCGADVADRTRIIYGGSVKPSNSRELLGQDDIDGALVGGASLDAKQFAAIVRSAH